MENKQILKLLKHHNCNVTDLNVTNPTCKLTSKTTLVQGIFSVNSKATLDVSDHIMFIVGDTYKQVNDVMHNFCVAMIEKGWNVDYDPVSMQIKAIENE